jgi:hypothetical protein
VQGGRAGRSHMTWIDVLFLLAIVLLVLATMQGE